MTPFVDSVSKLDPNVRRALIMLLDVAMVLVTIPVSLLLSQSNLSFDPFSLPGLAVWAGVIVFSHLLFRFAGLYDTVWRFASTPDFFNIIKNCGFLALGLYLIALLVRSIEPQTGLNERQFIVFFLVAFTIISAPRLIYRYLREGAGWGLQRKKGGNARRKHALFVGNLGEADVIIRFTDSSAPQDTVVVGILSIEEEAPIGMKLRGVPVVGKRPRLVQVLEEYARGTRSIDLLIFGQGTDKEIEEFAELVRIARKNEIAVQQFSGFSQLRQRGKVVLEAVEMETILRRTPVPSDLKRLGSFLKGKRILVTGGAGSIGRTLVKRSLDMNAEAVLVADLSEFGVFQLQNQVQDQDLDRLTCRILDVGDRAQFSRVVADFRPDMIFHAAALKHVPLLEDNWISAIKTNVLATLTCAEVAAEHCVPQFVMISSDKAADPSSVLGLTKRVAEQIVNALHYARRVLPKGGRKTNYIAVRFGNVFGSDGSVATIFEKQIREGGPVTITDRAMTRYLMTMGEAVDLVIMAAADSATRRAKENYGIYMLDMGEPVSILTVAETMIRLAGKKPYAEIAIEETGIRPGEKLHEALSAQGEIISPIDVPKIFGLKTGVFDWQEITWATAALTDAIAQDDKAAAITIMDNLHRPASQDDPEPVSVAV